MAYTGLRPGDVVRLGRRHVRDGVATHETEKGGFTVTVTLLILPVLRKTLEAGPCGDLTFVAGANGKPLTKESFGNMFKQACRAARVPGSAHSVRKIAETRAAENGAAVAGARSDLRLARGGDGFALHSGSQPGAACQRGDAQASER